MSSTITTAPAICEDATTANAIARTSDLTNYTNGWTFGGWITGGTLSLRSGAIYIQSVRVNSVSWTNAGGVSAGTVLPTQCYLNLFLPNAGGQNADLCPPATARDGTVLEGFALNTYGGSKNLGPTGTSDGQVFVYVGYPSPYAQLVGVSSAQNNTLPLIQAVLRSPSPNDVATNAGITATVNYDMLSPVDKTTAIQTAKNSGTVIPITLANNAGVQRATRTWDIAAQTTSGYYGLVLKNITATVSHETSVRGCRTPGPNDPLPIAKVMNQAGEVIYQTSLELGTSIVYDPMVHSNTGSTPMFGGVEYWTLNNTNVASNPDKAKISYNGLEGDTASAAERYLTWTFVVESQGMHVVSCTFNIVEVDGGFQSVT